MSFRVYMRIVPLIGLLVIFISMAEVAAKEYIYASDPSKGMLYVIDSANYRVIDKVHIKGRPVGLWPVNNKLIYIADETKKTLGIYETAKRAITGVQGVDISSLKSATISESLALFCGSGTPSPSIWKIAPASQKVVSKLRLPSGSEPEAIGFAPNGNLYITDSSRERIYVVNPGAMELVTQIETNGRYINMALAKNGMAYFTGADKNWDSGDWIDVWDTNQNAFVKRLTGLLPTGDTFIDQAEGISSQREMLIEQNNNILVVIAFGSIKNTAQSPILIGIDLATQHIVWKIKPLKRGEEPIALAGTSKGEIYLTTTQRMVVVNSLTGEAKVTIPLSNVWGLAVLSE